MYATSLMFLPYMYWQMWTQTVRRQWLPLAERAVNDTSAPGERNVVQLDASPRYVG